MLTRSLAITSIATVGVVLASLPAAADDPVAIDRGRHGAGQSAEVVLNPRDSGDGGASSGGGGKSTGVGSPRSHTCLYQGTKVDCTSSFGVWSQSDECWVQRMSPQPSFDDPLWSGREDGAIYWCQPPARAGSIGGGHAFWAPSAGAAGAPVLVDPVTLAEEAVESMHLQAIGVGITPPQGPDTYTLVGIPTWMWVDDPTPRTWGPIRRSTSAGAVTVTANAKATKVVWDMGDGDVVSCGTGTPYDPTYQAEPSPNCGHVYAAPGRYHVTATSYWEVDWAGAGQSGTITFTLTRDAAVWVREAYGLISRQG